MYGALLPSHSTYLELSYMESWKWMFNFCLTLICLACVQREKIKWLSVKINNLILCVFLWKEVPLVSVVIPPKKVCVSIYPYLSKYHWTKWDLPLNRHTYRRFHCKLHCKFPKLPAKDPPKTCHLVCDYFIFQSWNKLLGWHTVLNKNATTVLKTREGQYLYFLHVTGILFPSPFVYFQKAC